MAHFVIVGARSFVPYLIRSINPHGFTVIVIERNPERCAEISSEGIFKVINGDGEDMAILELAGIKKCAGLLALTNTDETNLSICKLARNKYHIHKTLAWVNNPLNEELFTAAGICCFSVVPKIASEIDDPLICQNITSYVRTARIQEVARRLYAKANHIKARPHDDSLKPKLDGLAQGYVEAARMLEGLLHLKIFIHD